MTLLDAFTTAVLPIVAIAAVGYGLGRTTPIEVGPLNTVGLYVMVPALAAHSVATTSLGGGAVLKLSVGVVAYAVGMTLLGGAVGRLTDQPPELLGVVMLAGSFPNSGFIGIPLNDFAFGGVGRTTAVLYLTVQNVVVYTLGVAVASGSSGTDWTDAATEIFRLPLVYAVLAGVAARLLGVVPPSGGTAMSTLAMVGDASIPLMLLILGIQLADTEIAALSKTVVPTVLKLAVAPAVGLALAVALAFDDPTVARVFVLECATPAAVIPLVLVIEYADDVAADGLTAPELMSTVIFVTTVLSIPVLSVLVWLLRSGVVL